MKIHIRSRSSLPALLSVVAACTPAPPVETPPARGIPTSATAAPTTPVSAATSPAKRERNRGPNGELARRQGSQVDVELATGEVITVPPSQLHPPSGDRSLFGISPTALRYLDSGVLLVGMGDGTVAGVDKAGKRLFWAGFRGAIRDMTPVSGDAVAVTTSRGVVGLLRGDGKVQWQIAVTAEPLGPVVIGPDNLILVASQRGVFGISLDGKIVFSHASPALHVTCPPYTAGCTETEPAPLTIDGPDVVIGGNVRFPIKGPHVPVPDLEPKFNLTFTRVLRESVVSILPDGPNAILALVSKRKDRSEYDWTDDDKYDVVRVEGSKISRFGVPEKASKSEVFEVGSQAAKSPFFIDGLVRGPTGDPWILARRISFQRTQSIDSIMGMFGGAGQILELVNGKVRERRDLFSMFASHWLSTPIAASPTDVANTFCFGLESPICAVYTTSKTRFISTPNPIFKAVTVGKALWLIDQAGAVHRLSNDGQRIEPVSPAPPLPVRDIAGAGESHAWAIVKDKYTLLHSVASRWSETPIPVPATTLFVRASNDVWAGRTHWDGTEWSTHHSAPPATVAFTIRPADVWVGDADGLWHGVGPGSLPVKLPSPSAKIPAANAARLVPGSVDSTHVVTPVTFQIDRTTVLRSAMHVSAGSDGTLWFGTLQNTVEVDSMGRAAVVRQVGQKLQGRTSLVESKGQGLVLDESERLAFDMRDVVRSTDGTKSTILGEQLYHHDLVAVAGLPGGATWILGQAPDLAPGSPYHLDGQDRLRSGLTAWAEFGAHAMVRPAKGTPFQPVMGLPSVAWCDVAVTSDGGAFFVGGQSDGPSGQGIVFHARGKLGTEQTSEFRAQATLLAVGAVSPTEAWAVGAGGTVLHIKDGAAGHSTLTSGE